MAHTFAKKRLIDLTRDEYRQCYNLNFRNNGEMRYALMQARANECKKAKVVMATEEGVLIGWALITWWPRARYLAKWDFMVYVRKTHRRRGIGYELAKRAHSYVRAPKAYHPHDLASDAFFDKVTTNYPTFR